MVEYPAFAPFAFIFGPFILFWQWVREELNPRIFLQLIGTTMVGLAFYLLSAWSFYGSETYELMDDVSFFRILWIIWRDQYYFLTRVLPRTGWLIIILITIVPWFACLFLARRGLNEDPNPTLFLLHTTITVLAACTVLNMEFIREPISKSFLYLVMPDLLTASLFGYLAAYWYLLPMAISSDSEKSYLLWLRHNMGRVFAVLFLVLIVVLPCLNYNESNGKKADFMEYFTTRVIETIDDVDWLIINGSIEDNLLVKNHELKKNINIINIARTRNDVYLRYVGKMLQAPILKSYAEVGLLPMLKIWIASDENVYRDIAIFNMPDLWRALGYQPIPDRLVFRGGKSHVEDAHELFVAHSAFWNGEKFFREIDSGKLGSLSYLYRNCVRHMGMIANNLGVLLEDNTRSNEAFAAYSEALAMDADNISALLNKLMMAERGYEGCDIESIKKRLAEISGANRYSYGLWTLSNLYGYVRHPEALARQGMMWALSGRPDIAIDGLKRAEKLVPAESRQGLHDLLARMYMNAGRPGDSESIYRDILAEKPDDSQAIMGMVRVSLLKNAFDEARKYLKKAENVGVPQAVRNIQWAILAINTGNIERARVIVENTLLDDPDNVSLLTLLADVLVRQKDDDALARCLNRIEEKEGGKMTAFLLRGELDLRNKNIKSAYAHLERALSYQTDNLYLMERLLRLDFVMGNKGRTYNRARSILNVNADHAFANYVLGVIKMTDNQYDIAEASFRKSIQSRETPEALNDLAWLLFKKGEYEDAEKQARSVIELRADMYTAWDTLGVILLEKEDIVGAENALQKAMSLYSRDYRVHLHMAELQIAKGDKKAARDLLDIVFSKMKLLPVEDHRKVVELRRQVRE